MIWKATGMRALLRRIDFSSASVISARVSFPAEARAARLCHTSDSDLPMKSGDLIDTPLARAQPMISRAVCGPQFRAVARCWAVSLRSSASGGTQGPFGGLSPISSGASSFSTLTARTLNAPDEETFSLQGAVSSRETLPRLSVCGIRVMSVLVQRERMSGKNGDISYTDIIATSFDQSDIDRTAGNAILTATSCVTQPRARGPIAGIRQSGPFRATKIITQIGRRLNDD